MRLSTIWHHDSWHEEVVNNNNMAWHTYEQNWILNWTERRTTLISISISIWYWFIQTLDIIHDFIVTSVQFDDHDQNIYHTQYLISNIQYSVCDCHCHHNHHQPWSSQYTIIVLLWGLTHYSSYHIIPHTLHTPFGSISCSMYDVRSHSFFFGGIQTVEYGIPSSIVLNLLPMLECWEVSNFGSHGYFWCFMLEFFSWLSSSNM